MKTNRTLEILRMYNFTEKNHWQLMCDLSNNDYDIDYFGGRESINYAFDEISVNYHKFRNNFISDLRKAVEE